MKSRNNEISLIQTIIPQLNVKTISFLLLCFEMSNKATPVNGVGPMFRSIEDSTVTFCRIAMPTPSSALRMFPGATFQNNFLWLGSFRHLRRCVNFDSNSITNGTQCVGVY